ncbi:MAG: PHP domain-containing protein [Dehalococcoidia bacterium]
MSIGDFHTHSTLSDGRLTPTQPVDLAASRGVTTMALADHDTLAGYSEAQAAAARHPGFCLVPAVRISCDLPSTGVHMLGLFVDPANARLNSELARFRIGREGAEMVDALARQGVPITWERVREFAGEAAVGRPHLALALIEAGHVATFNEAFDEFLGRGMPPMSTRHHRSRRGHRDDSRGRWPAGLCPPLLHEGLRDGRRALRCRACSAWRSAHKAGRRFVELLRVLAERLGLFARWARRASTRPAPPTSASRATSPSRMRSCTGCSRRLPARVARVPVRAGGPQ